MSDTELASELQKYDSRIGPIVESTRAVYQRKLASLMSEVRKISCKYTVEFVLCSDLGRLQLTTGVKIKLIMRSHILRAKSNLVVKKKNLLIMSLTSQWPLHQKDRAILI